MTFIPTKTIEDKAFNLLQKYSSNNNWQISFPIPVELIIETELKYSNSVENLGDERILGAIDQVNKIIYTNENVQNKFDKYKGLYEFTLAHEIGHWDLHCNYLETQLTINEIQVSLICRDGDNDFKEVQANKYAAALLMPELLVKEKLKNLDYLNWSALYKISEAWQVSISALKNRLESLNLLYYDDEKKVFYPSKDKAFGQLGLF
jgi:Zn-dependent peptidase ImmA (M78 family)